MSEPEKVVLDTDSSSTKSAAAPRSDVVPNQLSAPPETLEKSIEDVAERKIKKKIKRERTKKIRERQRTSSLIKTTPLLKKKKTWRELLRSIITFSSTESSPMNTKLIKKKKKSSKKRRPKHLHHHHQKFKRRKKQHLKHIHQYHRKRLHPHKHQKMAAKPKSSSIPLHLPKIDLRKIAQKIKQNVQRFFQKFKRKKVVVPEEKKQEILSVSSEAGPPVGTAPAPVSSFGKDAPKSVIQKYHAPVQYQTLIDTLYQTIKLKGK